jgi:hypothetical protein
MVILMEVHEKRWSEGKPYERIGIAVLRFDEQILKDMEMWYGLLSLYLGV